MNRTFLEGVKLISSEYRLYIKTFPDIGFFTLRM